MSVKMADLLRVLRAMYPEQLMADNYAGALKRAEELLCSLGLADWDKSAHRPKSMSASSYIPIGAPGDCSPRRDDPVEGAAEPIFKYKTRSTFTDTSTCKGAWAYCRDGRVCVLDHDNKFRAVPCPVCALSQPPSSGGKSIDIGAMPKSGDLVYSKVPVDKDVIGPEDHPAPLLERKGTELRYRPIDQVYKKDVLHHLSMSWGPLTYDELRARMAYPKDRDGLRDLLRVMLAMGDVHYEGELYSLPKRSAPNTVSEQEAVEVGKEAAQQAPEAADVSPKATAREEGSR